MTPLAWPAFATVAIVLIICLVVVWLLERDR